MSVWKGSIPVPEAEGMRVGCVWVLCMRGWWSCIRGDWRVGVFVYSGWWLQVGWCAVIAACTD